MLKKLKSSRTADASGAWQSDPAVRRRFMRRLRKQLPRWYAEAGVTYDSVFGTEQQAVAKLGIPASLFRLLQVLFISILQRDERELLEQLWLAIQPGADLQTVVHEYAVWWLDPQNTEFSKGGSVLPSVLACREMHQAAITGKRFKDAEWLAAVDNMVAQALPLQEVWRTSYTAEVEAVCAAQRLLTEQQSLCQRVEAGEAVSFDDATQACDQAEAAHLAAWHAARVALNNHLRLHSQLGLTANAVWLVEMVVESPRTQKRLREQSRLIDPEHIVLPKWPVPKYLDDFFMDNDKALMDVNKQICRLLLKGRQRRIGDKLRTLLADVSQRV